ncbi:MAG: phosphomannomutase/phosphoglucomutase [Casimicrobiaceae bacterium]|nr:phosphomannomutase/phosphoglucomutase [Casimicrobiaceae bacterium]
MRTALTALPADIFKAYDIRGIVGKTLTAEIAQAIGHALGSLALERGACAIAVGRDGRLSGPELSEALRRGIAASGCDAIDLGVVPTPVSYFAAHHLGTQSAVSVTGSHNPPEYNGFKMVVAGETLWGETIQTLRRRAETGDLRKGSGQLLRVDVRHAYIERVLSDVKLARPMKIAVDCGNGAAGEVATAVLRGLGCTLTELYCDIDGHFPNHHPDPSKPENLNDLIEAVRTSEAELGLAFDGDGDRLGVVTKSGQIVYPDRQMMLFAADVLSRHPGAPIIYDVKCSRLLDRVIREHGGVPLMWKTGHSLIKAKLKETGAPLAGEMSGHIFFKERWYGFDDAIYCAARLLEILARHDDPSAVLEALPNSTATPEINLACPNADQHALIERLRECAVWPGAERVITVDGVRAEWADGFGLARPSNTTPVIVLRFEADTPEALERIRNAFLAELTKVGASTAVAERH